MIDDSTRWREDLTRFAGSVERARHKSVTSDSGLARLERDHMYGFFAVRRLMECFKLSTDTLNLVIRLKHFRFRAGSHLTLANWRNLDRHYELDRPLRSSVRLRELSNQVIHSYVFALSFDRGNRLAGLFVSSELRRRKALAFVPAWRTARIFRLVAKD